MPFDGGTMGGGLTAIAFPLCVCALILFDGYIDFCHANSN